ncbi:glycosyltransferase family 1 protein [bacterium]|nr:MAG: glycosyltransferase family 1 protein [bacterium]
MSRPIVVFVAPSTGTFTPTHSGALSTDIHECALQARMDGFDPIVIARQGPPDIAPWDDVKSYFVPYPNIPTGSFAERIGRFERRLLGWRHVGQRVYTARLARTLRENGLTNAPLFPSNDPDGVVFLRSCFPQARLYHRFHNQMESKPRVRAALGNAASANLCVSDFTSRWIEKYYSTQASTVYDGVNLEEFTPALTSPSGPTVLNFVGRTGHEKAPDIFLEAARLLSEARRDFGVQLVGSNHWGEVTLDEFQRKLQELSAQIEKNGVKVRQTGHVPRARIADEFRRAHIHIVPSRWDEPFGLTTIEGMACGLATIASNTGGSPEIIADSGQLFERDNAADLAHQITLWLNAPELRRVFALKARKRAEEFSWARTWAGLRAAMES